MLPRHHFSLEHIVPRQALNDDPGVVKASVSASMRSGHVLLCQAPLTVKGFKPRGTGCNAWKGSYYDPSLRALMNNSVLNRKLLTERVTIAGFCAAYLAMVAEFGYGVVFTAAGKLARRQFFSPDRFLQDMPVPSQMLMMGQAPQVRPEVLAYWSNPFRITVETVACMVAIRNFVIRVPVSRDPRLPVARHLRFVPHKYSLRPDFDSVLD